MIEFFLSIAIGMTLGWFVIPAPRFLIAAKNALCKEFPRIKPYLRTDVE